MIPLRDYLLAAYGGFADRRRTDASQDHPIKIDDESAVDVSREFCRIFVTVPERDGVSFVLTMYKAPINVDAKSLILEQGGEIVSAPMGPTVMLKLQITNITFIRKLATTIRNSVGRGKRYTHPDWKWLCGRTADSLDRFADRLMGFRSERRSSGKCV